MLTNKSKVVILGTTGMLGSIILDLFTKNDDFDLIATYRNETDAEKLKDTYGVVDFRVLDVENTSVENIKEVVADAKWVVNAIGVIKPYIHDDNVEESERAIRINSLFPYNLGKATSETDAKVLQIATDCVYSGNKGQYIESDAHDALDVYGKTKSLGETYLDNMLHLRCSIVGPELKAHLSLLDWFLSQDNNAEVNGYTNHQWNGITTLHFARIIRGIIKEDININHIQHIVPGNLISKANLLKNFAKEFGRDDITINSVEAPKIIDRTLATTNNKLNCEIWKAAGYSTPPTIEQMIAELADYDFAKKII